MSSNLVNAVSGKRNDAITSGVTFQNLSNAATVCEVWTTLCGCRVIITSNLFLSRNTNSIRRRRTTSHAKKWIRKSIESAIVRMAKGFMSQTKCIAPKIEITSHSHCHCHCQRINFENGRKEKNTFSTITNDISSQKPLHRIPFVPKNASL